MREGVSEGVAEGSVLCWEVAFCWHRGKEEMNRERSVLYGHPSVCLAWMGRKKKLLLRHVSCVLGQVPSTHHCPVAPAAAGAEQDRCWGWPTSQEVGVQGKGLMAWKPPMSERDHMAVTFSRPESTMNSWVRTCTSLKGGTILRQE